MMEQDCCAEHGEAQEDKTEDGFDERKKFGSMRCGMKRTTTVSAVNQVIRPTMKRVIGSVGHVLVAPLSVAMLCGELNSINPRPSGLNLMTISEPLSATQSCLPCPP